MDQKDNERDFKLSDMISFYNLAEKDKKAIFEQTAARSGLPAYAVEKDWWVVQTLRVIFGMEIADFLTFKGGTSLSKAWKLIDRFSEDIDLVLDKSLVGIDVVDTKKKVKSLRSKTKKYITHSFMTALVDEFKEAGLSEIEIHLLNTKPENNDPVEIKIDYPKIVDYPGYFKSGITVEIGSRSQREPNSIKLISSFVKDLFPENDFADTPFEINTINAERTFLEKIFLLHELFQAKINEIHADRMSRHLYDIERLMDTDFEEKALSNQELYRDIVRHRKLMFSYSFVDYSKHQPKYINPIPPEEIHKEWKKDYEIMSESMIYGAKPSWETLITRISQLKERINKLDWEI